MNGSTSVVPLQIVIGHEFLHASHIDKGIVATGNANSIGSNFDPDLGGSGKPFSNEEITTRKEENVLRKEQGIDEMRADPVGKDSSKSLPDFIVYPN